MYPIPIYRDWNIILSPLAMCRDLVKEYLRPFYKVVVLILQNLYHLPAISNQLRRTCSWYSAAVQGLVSQGRLCAIFFRVFLICAWLNALYRKLTHKVYCSSLTCVLSAACSLSHLRGETEGTVTVPNASICLHYVPESYTSPSLRPVQSFFFFSKMYLLLYVSTL